MKIPLTPPDPTGLLARLQPNELARLIALQGAATSGRYLHWDELRHQQPPAGFSLEEWWLSIWLTRAPLLKSLPLLDRHGQPFRFAVPEAVQVDLHHIDRDAAGQIQASASAPIHENRERYLLHSLIEEAITSSQLEGASTTRRVAEAMLLEGRRPEDRSEAMIFNNYAAMEHIRSLRNQPITPERILELHWMLTVGTLDEPADVGRLRQSDDVKVVDNRTGAVLHDPPHWAELPSRLERLCAFANEGEGSAPFVHPVVRAILLHFMIGYDHPFADGNGRTARALFYWAMARSGYWLMEFLSISPFLRQAPAQYVTAYLHTETDGGDTTYFVLHQLGTIRKSIDALYAYLARKTGEQKDAQRLLAGSPALRGRLNHRQVALLSHALRNPGEAYRVSAHQQFHRVVYQTARTDLLELEALGFLDKFKQGQAFVFHAPEDLKERIERAAKG